MKPKFIDGVDVSKADHISTVTFAHSIGSMPVIFDKTNQPISKEIEGKAFVAVAADKGVRWMRKEAFNWRKNVK